MRRAAFVTTLVLLVTFAAAIADLTAPFAQVGVGSYSASPRADGLQPAPADPNCRAPSNGVCAGRLAYAPDRKLTAWFSVRNESPVAITLDGVPDAWFKQFAPEFLVRPVVALDGGDPTLGMADLGGTPFRPVVLAPHAQRLVGVEFRTTGDVAYACAHWGRGIAVGWEWLPIEWHWAATRHEVKIVLPQPIEMATPTAGDCAS
jgi:hypothetical protein